TIRLRDHGEHIVLRSARVQRRYSELGGAAEDELHRGAASDCRDGVGLLGFVGHLDLTQRALVDPAGEQHAVEMVDLVLDCTRQQAVTLDADLLPVTVEPLRDNTLTARHLADDPWYRQPTLEPSLLAV